jgi:uncharacterized membrane protein
MQAVEDPRPRPDGLRWGSFGLALLGVADAIYLTWIKLSHAPAAFCAPGGGCDTVNTSPYSEMAGIPVSVFGLGMYLALAALLALEGRWALSRTYGRLAVFGLSLTGVLYSAYLTYLELFVIHAICPYCVVSAVLITLIFALAVVRLIRAPAPGDSLSDQAL